jgi:hypothetical protein
MTANYRTNPDLSLPNLLWTFGSAVANASRFATRSTGSAVAAVGKCLDIATVSIVAVLAIAVTVLAAIVAFVYAARKDIMFCAVAIGVVAFVAAYPMVLVGGTCVAVFGWWTKP